MVERFEQYPATVVALGVDPTEKSRALIADLSLTFPVLTDPSLEVAGEYGVVDEENGIAWPAVFIIRQDGQVAWRSISETYKKRPSAGELLDRLDAMAGPDRDESKTPAP